MVVRVGQPKITIYRVPQDAKPLANVGTEGVEMSGWPTFTRSNTDHGFSFVKEGADVKGNVRSDLKEQPYEAQLHLEMDGKSYAQLNWLKGALEAASFGEVIRRSLQAFEVFDPDEGGSADLGNSGPTTLAVAGIRSKMKRMHVRIPLRTKERLDRAKEDCGGTYSDVINRSLQLLAQLVRNREAILEELKGDDQHATEDAHDHDRNLANLRRVAAAVF